MLTKDLIEYLERCNPLAKVKISVNELMFTDVECVEYNSRLQTVCFHDVRPNWDLIDKDADIKTQIVFAEVTYTEL